MEAMNQVFFATEYDTPNIVVNVLSKLPTPHFVFPLIVKYKPSTSVAFVLQTQVCEDSMRVGTVFICKNSILHLSEYVNESKPIPVRILIQSLDEEATFDLYRSFLLDEQNNNTLGESPNRTFSQLVHFYRDTLISEINDKYQSPTSPSWFLSTYGTAEGSLLLTMSYYLFEKQISTIQTTRDYVKCFTSNPGPTLFGYLSMAEFSKALLNSPFRMQLDRFIRYAKLRNRRDHCESHALDQEIDRFRSEARLPQIASVHYIYLAYQTALNSKRLIDYCDLVSYDPDLHPDEQCSQTPQNYLAQQLHDELMTMMDLYFSLDGYFQHYITISKTHVPITGTSYAGYQVIPTAMRASGFFGTSTAMAATIRRINRDTRGLFSPVTPNLKGLLQICASQRQITAKPLERTNSSSDNKNLSITDGLTRRDYLFKNSADQHSKAVPVFRLELAQKRHVFCALTRDAWNRELLPDTRFLNRTYISDEDLTETIWLREHIAATSDSHRQLFLTRHELFNENLPVFNFIGDLDLKLKPDINITRKTFFDLCRSLRYVIVHTWKHLFSNCQIDANEQRVFFFKTACFDSTASSTISKPHEPSFVPERSVVNEDDMLDDTFDDVALEMEFSNSTLTQTETPFCRCREKLGLRVIAPFPPGIALLGSNTMKQLAKILNHTMCLHPELLVQLNRLTSPDEFFDTGVYNHGHSLRMPLMYKVDPESATMLYGRLLPVFIVPPADQSSPLSFVLEQLSLPNLLHHADRNIRTTEIIYKIQDIGCQTSPSEDLNFLDCRRATLSARKAPSLYDLILRHLRLQNTKNSHDEPDSNLTPISDRLMTDNGIYKSEETENYRRFIRDIAWPPIQKQIQNHYPPEMTQQFSQTLLFDVSQRNQVAIKRLSCGQLQDFRCLSFPHKFGRENVHFFLDLKPETGDVLVISLWSRCFTQRCGSNRKQTHVSIHLDKPCW